MHRHTINREAPWSQSLAESAQPRRHSRVLFGGLWACLFVLLLASCNRPMYVGLHDLPVTGWHQDSTLTYAVPVTDSVNAYDILLQLRTGSNYPYQNLWLFISEYRDSVFVTCDTIECMLADDRGRWLGKGNIHHDLTLLYAPGCRFPHAGTYTYTITQGMREEVLHGVESVTVLLTPTP